MHRNKIFQFDSFLVIHKNPTKLATAAIPTANFTHIGSHKLSSTTFFSWFLLKFSIIVIKPC